MPLYQRLLAVALLIGGAVALFGYMRTQPDREPAVAAGTGSGVAARTERRFPVVVELYQSQGCSSCPPANAALNAIADDPAILPLSFAVTYWDQLGWKDTFASPSYTARQQAYADAGRGQVATPEFIINGTTAVVGYQRDALYAAIAGAAADGPDIAASAAGVSIAAADTSAPATVWLVRYDPRTHEVPISAGENDGRTLPHRNIVRELTRLGEWSGTAATFAVPPVQDQNLIAAVLVQRGEGGPILSARRI